MQESKEFVSRLLKYRNVLLKLKGIGIVKVFSDNLGDASGVTASQVRKDFSAIGISGNKRGGYRIDDLIEKFKAIIGEEKEQKVIIVGCGNIGRALMEYKNFTSGHVRIVAGFDTDATKHDATAIIPIYPYSEMAGFIKKNAIRVGVIAVPENAVTQVYEDMLNAGIKGVLNFARVFLRESEGSIVSTVNIELKVENLCYFVNIFDKDKKK